MKKWIKVSKLKVIALRSSLDDKYYINPELIFQDKKLIPYIERYANDIKEILKKYNSGELKNPTEYNYERSKSLAKLRTRGFKKEHFALIHQRYNIEKLSSNSSLHSYRAANRLYLKLKRQNGPEYVKNEILMSNDPEFFPFYKNLIINNENTSWEDFVNRMESFSTYPKEPTEIISKFYEALEIYGDKALNRNFLARTPYKWIIGAVKKHMNLKWEDFKLSLDLKRNLRFIPNEKIVEKYLNQGLNAIKELLLVRNINPDTFHSYSIEINGDKKKLINFLNENDIKRINQDQISFTGTASGEFHEKLRVYNTFIQEHGEEPLVLEGFQEISNAVYDPEITLKEFYNLFKINLGIDFLKLKQFQNMKKEIYSKEPLEMTNNLENETVKAFNIKKYKEAKDYNWKQHEFRENWKGREKVNRWQGINVGDVFETKNGPLDIIEIQVDDVKNPKYSSVWLVLKDENGEVLNPYKLRNDEWGYIGPKR